MALGQSTQDATYNKPVNEAFADVQEALSIIGEVKNADKVALTVEGTSRYGFQSVKLKVKITPQGDISALSISGFSDDVWAAGAKNCTKRLLEALNNLGNLDYKPSRTGMKPITMALTLTSFIAVLLVVMIVLANLPKWVFVVVAVIGFGTLAYFLIARMKFGKK